MRGTAATAIVHNSSAAARSVLGLRATTIARSRACC